MFAAAPGPEVLLILFVAVFAFSILLLLIKRYRRCPSNKVLVVYGKVTGQQAAKCVLCVVIHAHPATLLEKTRDLVPGRGERVIRCRMPGEEGVEQHVFLNVLLLGAIGDQGQRTVIVGEAVEIQVLRQHHRVAVQVSCN